MLRVDGLATVFFLEHGNLHNFVNASLYSEIEACSPTVKGMQAYQGYTLNI